MQTFLLLLYHLSQWALLSSNENHSPDNGRCAVDVVAIATEATQPQQQNEDDDEEDTSEHDSKDDPRVLDCVFVGMWRRLVTSYVVALQWYTR